MMTAMNSNLKNPYSHSHHLGRIRRSLDQMTKVSAKENDKHHLGRFLKYRLRTNKTKCWHANLQTLKGVVGWEPTISKVLIRQQSHKT